MGLKERLILITKELGLSGRAFERECGLTKGAFSGFGDRIGAGILSKILIKYPQFSARWILTGEGDMYEKGSQNCFENSGEIPNCFENSGEIPKDIFDRIMKLTDTIASQHEVISSQQETIKSQHETIRMLSQRVPAVAIDAVARMAAGE